MEPERGHVPSFSLDAEPQAARCREGNKLPRASIPFEKPTHLPPTGSLLLYVPGSCLVRRGPRRSSALLLSIVSGGARSRLFLLLQHQAIGSTNLSHESLSELSPVILRFEDVMLVSPLCDSHAKHVEKTVHENSREVDIALPRRISNRRAGAGLVGQHCSTIASESFDSGEGQKRRRGRGGQSGPHVRQPHPSIAPP